MRIERIELKDVGPFDDAVLEIPEPAGPGELVLFEGPNGCGKSTVAGAIALAAAGPMGRKLRLDEPDETSPAYLHAAPPLADFVRRLRSREASISLLIAHGDGSLLDVTLAPVPEWTTARPCKPPGCMATAIQLITDLADAARSAPHRVKWAAYAYQPHHPTARLATQGPRDIEDPPLKGALSFGARYPASGQLGQFLVNLEFELVKAERYARAASAPDERARMNEAARAREQALSRFTEAMTRVLGRKVTIEFPFEQHTPRLRLDGDEVPLDLLGEGLRSTTAWLSDLLVRLLRTSWEDTERSPFDQDFWLILDEVDEGLHPTMQARLFPALRELFPNARIYATTHSPFVVASAAEGYIFPLRPDKDHRVRGKIEPKRLEPGQSLEWVVTEIFEAHAGFVDEETRQALEAHKRDIRSFQRKGQMDWSTFLDRRAWLLQLNDEVRTVVYMQEVPIRDAIDRAARGSASSPGGDAP